jgi:hypothetical protein
MNQKPPWLFDVETEKQECRLTLAKLVAQIEGLRQLWRILIPSLPTLCG